MEDKKETGQDYFLVTFCTLCGLAMTIANAIVCQGTWQTIWIVIAMISVICYIISWVLNCTVKDGFGQLLIYLVYSFVMFFAGYNTPMISDWCLSQTKYLTLHHYGKEQQKKVHGRV